MKNWIVAIIVIVLGLAAWYLYSVRQAAVDEAPAPPALVEPAAPPPAPEKAPAESAAVTPAPAIEPETEQLPLPALAESDPAAVEALSGLIGAQQTEQYVVSEDVIPRMVATIDSLSGRQVPGAILVVQGPGGAFEATADENPDAVIRDEAGDPIPQFVMDPANYQRYTPYVEMLEGVDATRLAATYRDYQPLFDEAFRQLGYPEGDFGQRLGAVIDELLATPEVTERVRLIKPEAYYLFADEALESLTAGQKALIRMGPENAARVKAKLVEIRAAL
jgi:hypothetical protein